MADLEHRAVLELRVAGRRLEGIAAPFGVDARIADFTEVIRPQAFDATLEDGHDIIALVDHDPGKLLARTRSGTLRLGKSGRGLAFELSAPDTMLGRDVLTLAERGDLGGMSFGFRVRQGGETWTGRRRELRAVDLVEISVVHSWPAYSATSVSARGAEATASPRARPTGPGDGLMGILRRLVDRLDPVEQRAAVGGEFLMDGWPLNGGPAVNAFSAQNLATVSACVQAIAAGIGSLPTWVYRRTATGREVDEAHPLMRLVRQGANGFQSWPDFVEWLIASTLLAGNGLAEIVTDARGAVVELRPIPWSWASPQLLSNGRLAYDVVTQIGPFGATGRTRRLLQDQALHLRDRSDDGVLGVSRVRRAAAVVSGALGVQTFANGALANGVYPSGVIQAEGKMSREQTDYLRERFKKFTGAENAAKALILDQGLKWTALTISPEDAELLASRRFTVEELARLFGVPPNLVGDLTNSSFTNSETMLRFFAQSTLAQWCRKLEAAFAGQVFSTAARVTHEVEFDLAGLLRGDPEQRWASHKIAVEAGILTVDEIRAEEGYDPRPVDAPTVAAV